MAERIENKLSQPTREVPALTRNDLRRLLKRGEELGKAFGGKFSPARQAEAEKAMGKGFNC